MTTTQTHDETSLPAVVPTQEITAAREHSMTQIQHALNAAWVLAEGLTDEAKAQAQHALTVAFENAQIMAARWEETQELLLRSVTLVQGQQIALEEVTKQRAAVLQELSDLLKALKNIDLNHPVMGALYGEVYERAMDDHNGAFWESLPYDMAETLGGKWQFMDADTLFQLIADPDLDLNAEGENWTLEQIEWARTQFLKVVRQMQAYQDTAQQGDK